MICGNKVSPFCPLLDYFDIPIKLTGKDRISSFKSGTIAIQIYSNKEHEQKREQSKFRIMVKNTEYDEYEHGGILNALELSLKSTYGYDCLWSFKTLRRTKNKKEKIKKNVSYYYETTSRSWCTLWSSN